MKTKLLFSFLLFLFLQFATAQDIGFLGDFSGWADDVNMNTTDNILYTKNNYYLPDTGLKFRQDDDWTNNWGGNTFPVGTATNDNIPATAGFYDIAFNLSGLNYTFISVSGTDQNVSIIGDFNGWVGDVVLSTTDNINYSATDVSLTTGGLKFRRDAGWAANYGGTTLSGTGVANGGDNIPIPADSNYDITFNLETLAYTIMESTLGIDENSININAFYINNSLNVSGYNGVVTIRTFDITGRLLQSIKNIQIQNGFTKVLSLPKNQLSFIVIEANNFNKTLKVIAH